MSYKTTDVSLNNNKKRNSELLGDPMICDDASRTDCDVDESKKQNNTNILKNKSEIPPKNDTPNSEVLITCEPPKSKKRKLSSFDELLHNLDYCVLYTNLTKLQFFLESDNNKCIFLLTKAYEEFFEMIVQDINILKSKSLDDDYRYISNKIIKAAAGKLLFYVFENKPEFLSNSEVTELYRALKHAVRMNELKYEFRIKCDETWGGKKSVMFEKVPVLIPSETAVNSDQTAGTSKQNPKTNVQNTEDPKSDTPKPASNPEFSQPVAPKSHGPKKDMLKPDTTKSNGSNIDVPKTDGPESHGPKKDVLKQDSSKSQDPKMDVLKPDAPESQDPKIDVPQTEAPESHGPKIDVLKPNALKSNGLNIDVLKTDGSESHGPKIDVLKQDSSKSQDPKMDVPQTDASESHGPKIDVLKPNAQKSNGPNIHVLKTDGPESHGPKKDVLKQDASKSQDPKMDVPQTDASESHGPKIDVLKPNAQKSNGPNIHVPKTDGPESHGPKKDVLKQDASKSQDPKMDVPQTEAPESHVPKIDVLKPNAHKSNGPNIHVPKTDGSESHGPKKDVLKPDTTKSNDPNIDMPKTYSPESHGSKIDVLKPDTTKSNGPNINMPKTYAPESHGPKIDVLKPNAHKSNGPNIDVLKTDGPESHGPKKDVLKQDASKSQDPKMDVPQTDAPESHGPKIDVLKPDTTKSNDPNIDMPKTYAPESHGSKIDVLKPDTTKSNGPNIDVLKPDAPKSNGLKIGVLKPDALESQDPKMDVQKIDAPKSQTPKTSDSWTLITEPQPDVAEPWFEKPKPLIRTRRQIKHENQKLFLKNTPKKFIEDTLNIILDFLSNDDMEKLVLVPKTPSELKFFRKCIPLCKSSVNLSQFGEEFRELHSRISRLMSRIKVDVTRKGLNAFNEITGIREVTYVKIPKNYISGSVACTEAKETLDGGEWESTPKKPKVNVQKALQLAATDNIKLDKVINLNQSLRSKKKDKKRKKAELKKAKKSKGASSSSSTSRDSSRDRVKAAMAAAFVPPGPKVAKRPSSEISQSPKNTFPSRPSMNTLRNVKLREAMSVPVQSDKAMRMMLGMGWNGGALGPRGDGITEPLMPALEIPRGAGFGLISHRTKTQNANPDTVPLPKKPKEPNPPAPVVPGTDIVVEKTKQLLLEDVTFDTVMNTTDPAKCNDLLSKPSKSTVGLQKRNSKQTTSKELPTQTRFSIESQKQGNTDLKLRLPFRMEILHGIWDLINSDASCKSLKFDERLNKKQRKFVTFAMQTLGGKKDNIRCMFSLEEIPICKQIRNKYMETQITVEARYFWDYKSIDLLKLPKKFNQPTPIVFENNENTATITNCNQIINSESLQSYILSTNGGTRETLKTIKNMRFKVLFLMNMLKFVKSLYEEYEVTFNKVLNAKEKLYMENVVDQINMRIKFGSSPAETKIGDQIREHVKDAFLGIMYDHEHTIITLSKYYRFKRLNRPDNAVRRKTQATVNLDDFTSETLIETKLSTDEPFNREIQNGDGEDKYKVSEDKFEVSEHTNEVTETDNTQVSTENTTANVSDDETSETLPDSTELVPYDSDDSSVEEYNNNNANVKVPKLLPGEEGVNISNFLYLYDKDKTNTAGIRDNSITNNDSASNVTENRNSKNNSGNGNVVIDNNDNQFIDIKRAGGEIRYTKDKKEEMRDAQDTQKKNNVDWEKAEYVMCVDYKEEVILNTEDSDPNIVVIEDSDSDNDCTENKAKDKIKNITENLPLEDFKGETDVIIKDIDAVKTMKMLNITEDLMEGINTEPVHGVVKDDSNAVIKKDESRTVINIDNSNAKVNLDDAMDVKQDKTKVAITQGESMIVFNSVESSKDKKVAQIKEGTSISPSDENIVKDDLVIKSDCDRIKKDDIGLSEDFCNTQSVVQTVGAGRDFLHDKDSEIKNVRIGHTHHPIRKLGTAKVEKIQWHISNCIKLATELPLLKCHGVQNGALFYTCHNKKTYDWLQNTIGVASYVKVFDTEEITKMALKLCGYFDFDSNYLFKMLEMYNKEISTKEWVVEKTEKNGDNIIFIVKMDQFSIKFIQESDLALFAGIDKVHFSPIWE